MAHLKGHDEHNKSSNGSYAQKIIFHPQNGTTMCLCYVRWALKSHYLVNGAILDSIVRLKPTIMRKWHDISPISPYIFWRGWHFANFHVGYSCKRFLEHVFIYIFTKKVRQKNWLLFAIFKAVFFLFGGIFNMTKPRKIKFENVPRSKILCWLRKSQSFFWYINRLKDIWTNGKSRYWCGKTGFPVFLVILQERKYFLE